MLWFLEDCRRKNGYYYMVLSYKDATGKRKQPWYATGLPVKGNKRKAEEMLREPAARVHAAHTRFGPQT